MSHPVGLVNLWCLQSQLQISQYSQWVGLLPFTTSVCSENAQESSNYHRSIQHNGIVEADTGRGQKMLGSKSNESLSKAVSKSYVEFSYNVTHRRWEERAEPDNQLGQGRSRVLSCKGPRTSSVKFTLALTLTSPYVLMASDNFLSELCFICLPAQPLSLNIYFNNLKTRVILHPSKSALLCSLIENTVPSSSMANYHQVM